MVGIILCLSVLRNYTKVYYIQYTVQQYVASVAIIIISKKLTLVNNSFLLILHRAS